MNIFFLDEDPRLAAKFLCDKHLSKMQLESAQLISTAINLIAPDIVAENPIYKSTHANHPSAKWIRECLGNYGWFVEHCYGMDEEWQLRGHDPHKSFKMIRHYIHDLYTFLPPRLSLTPIPFCGPDHYRDNLGIPSKYNNLPTTVSGIL
jgi:hypothetical protein